MKAEQNFDAVTLIRSNHMKTLLISGAPNPAGQTAFLENLLKQHLQGEVTTLNTFSAKLSPCIDCKYCYKTFGCSISDDMDIVYSGMDSYDNIVISAPIYFANLPGPILNLLSRFQIMFSARYIRHDTVNLKPKRGAVILSLGGFDPVKYGPDNALNASKELLRLLNAELIGTAISWKTDVVHVKDDTTVQQEIIELAKRLNKE